MPPALDRIAEPASVRQRLLGEQHRGPGQVLGVAAADHAGLGEERVDADTGRGRGRRVGCAGPAAAGRAAANHREQRLALGETAREPRELGGVTEGLQVQGRGRDVGVVVPRGQEVVARDVALVAERDERVDTQVELAREVHQDDAHPTGLAGHREAARGRDGLVKGGVEPDLRVVAEQPETVGTDEPDAVHSGGRRQLVLQAGTLFAQLSEPRGHDDRGPNAGRRGVEQHVVHARGGDAHHDQVHGAGDHPDARIGIDADQRASARVHRRDRAMETAGGDGAQHGGPDARAVGPDADDGHGSGPKQRHQRA